MMDYHRCSLQADNIGFAYPDGKVVFENISLSVKPGEIVSILGPNGAGKTTLLNCLANLNKVKNGHIRINGKDMSSLPAKEVARHIGYVPQMIMPSFDFSVADYVVTGCAPRMGTFERPGKEHYDAAWAAIREMHIEHLAEKSYMHISGGERQQVAIARALAQRPAFILMDEPTAHLDYGNQLRVLMTIQKLSDQGFGVILTTHNPDYCLLLDGKIAVLDRSGELKFGESSDILSEKTLSELYRMPLRILEEESLNRKVCASPRLEDIKNEYIQ